MSEIRNFLAFYYNIQFYYITRGKTTSKTGDRDNTKRLNLIKF